MFVLSVDLRIKPENVESFIAKAVENSADFAQGTGLPAVRRARRPDRPDAGDALRGVRGREGVRCAPADRAFQKYIAEAVPLLASRRRHVWERPAP